MPHTPHKTQVRQATFDTAVAHLKTQWAKSTAFVIDDMTNGSQCAYRATPS